MSWFLAGLRKTINPTTPLINAGTLWCQTVRTGITNWRTKTSTSITLARRAQTLAPALSFQIVSHAAPQINVTSSVKIGVHNGLREIGNECSRR